jgi:hypothetical protein
MDLEIRNGRLMNVITHLENGAPAVPRPKPCPLVGRSSSGGENLAVQRREIQSWMPRLVLGAGPGITDAVAVLSVLSRGPMTNSTEGRISASASIGARNPWYTIWE